MQFMRKGTALIIMLHTSFEGTIKIVTTQLLLCVAEQVFSINNLEGHSTAHYGFIDLFFPMNTTEGASRKHVLRCITASKNNVER